MTPSRAPGSEGPPQAFCRGLLRVFLLVALAVAFLQRLASAQTTPTPAPAPASAEVQAADPIPLAVGNAWIYEGEVWWMPRGLRRIYREQVTWTMEITDVRRRGPWTAAILHGHPYDLVWYEQGRERGTYLFLVRARKTGAPRVFLLRGHRVWEAWRRLEDREDKLEGLARPAELVLDLPLHPGKRFCPGAPPATRVSKASASISSPTPGPDCWSVKKKAPGNLRAVRGAEDFAEPVLFSVSQRTPVEHSVWTFVPGLGFTSYAYGHNGQVSAVELTLTDFHQPARMGDTALDD